MAEQKRGAIEKINLLLQKLLDSFLDGVIERNDYTVEKVKLMSRKKSLQEQSSALLNNRSGWLEPFQSWILTSKNAGGIAISGSPQEKKALAQKVFSSNLVLDCKKARGCRLKPWSDLLESNQTGGMVRMAGLEPAHLAALPPQSSVSANSTTCATTGNEANSSSLLQVNCSVGEAIRGLFHASGSANLPLSVG